MNVSKIIKKGVTEKYDGIMSIANFQLNDSNIEMYGSYEDEHISNLQETIVKDGLKNPITLYKDGKTIKSGHNRYFAIKGLGIVEAPYTISTEDKPKVKLDEMVSLAIENMGRPANMGRSYNSVKKMCEVWSEENDGFKAAPAEVKTYCGFHQIGINSYNQLASLETKHPDLFQRVIDNRQSLTSAWSDKKMRENGSGIVLNQTPYMNGLIGLKELNYGISTVSAVRNQMEAIKIRKPGGEEGKAFDEIQKNVIGGVVHEIFTNAIRDIVNYSKGEEILKAPKNNALYDLEAEMKQSGIETKTCVTETGSKPKFAGHRYKDGYHVLLSVTPNGDRFFAGYGVIPADCWKKGMPVGTLDMNKLSEVSTFNVIIGSIEMENKKLVVHHDKVQL